MLHNSFISSVPLFHSDTLFAALVHEMMQWGIGEPFLAAAKEGGVYLSSIFALNQPYHFGIRRNRQHRVTGHADTFLEPMVAAGKGLFLVGFDSGTVSPEMFSACVRSLGESGIGGGRSVGRGSFRIESIEAIPDPRRQDGILASVAVPDENEVELFNGFAGWLDRNGYTEESWRGSGNRRKNGIWALPEGIKVRKMRGRITILDPAAGIIHYGIALILGEDFFCRHFGL